MPELKAFLSMMLLRWVRTGAVLTAAAVGVGLAAGAPASPAPGGEVLVRFRGDRLPFRKFWAGSVPGPAAAAAAWARRPDVLWAEPNGLMERCTTPDDPGYPLQWNFDNPVNGGIHVEGAWNLITARKQVPGAGAVVAVVDTGLAFEDTDRFARCPDISADRIAPGYNFVANTNHPNDDHGHGTHVAGTIAAGTNDGIGFAGIAYGATLMPVRVLDGSGRGSYDRIALGIRFAADHGAHVINLSLGAAKTSRAVADALQFAVSRGATVVAAAGNAGRRRAFYPAAYPPAIAVAATRFDEKTAEYSNFGSYVDLAGPGGDPFADRNDDGRPDLIFQLSFLRDPRVFVDVGEVGTSMACAHVSGVAALVVGLGVRGAAVRRVLQNSARDLGPRGPDARYGAGLVDAEAAVRAASASAAISHP
jgi:serine protease